MLCSECGSWSILEGIHQQNGRLAKHTGHRVTQCTVEQAKTTRTWPICRLWVQHYACSLWVQHYACSHWIQHCTCNLAQCQPQPEPASAKMPASARVCGNENMCLPIHAGAGLSTWWICTASPLQPSLLGGRQSSSKRWWLRMCYAPRYVQRLCLLCEAGWDLHGCIGFVLVGSVTEWLRPPLLIISVCACQLIHTHLQS